MSNKEIFEKVRDELGSLIEDYEGGRFPGKKEEAGQEQPESQLVVPAGAEADQALIDTVVEWAVITKNGKTLSEVIESSARMLSSLLSAIECNGAGESFSVIWDTSKNLLRIADLFKEVRIALKEGEENGEAKV